MGRGDCWQLWCSWWRIWLWVICTYSLPAVIFIFFFSDIGNDGVQCDVKKNHSSFSTFRLVFLVRRLVISHIGHLTLFFLEEISYGVMRSPIVNFLVQYFGMCVSFFGSSQFTLVLWPYIPIFVDIFLSFEIYVAWLSLVYLSYLFIRNGLGGLVKIRSYSLTGYWV